MARILPYIFFCVWILCPLGCTPPTQTANDKPRVPADGITVEDIKPVDTVKLPPPIVFRIFVFEVPADQVEKLEAAFAMLDRKPIRFVNAETFAANDFAVGLGAAENWENVGKILADARASRKQTKNLVVYDDSGDDISVTMLETEQSVSYVDIRGRQTAAVFFPGRFAWTLRARPLESLRGVAQIEIRPVYRFGMDSLISRLAQYREATPFDAGGFGLRMSPGDFLLLGASRQNADKLSLSRLLFSNSEDDSVLRLFMIGCVRVGN